MLKNIPILLTILALSIALLACTGITAQEPTPVPVNFGTKQIQFPTPTVPTPEQVARLEQLKISSEAHRDCMSTLNNEYGIPEKQETIGNAVGSISGGLSVEIIDHSLRDRYRSYQAALLYERKRDEYDRDYKEKLDAHEALGRELYETINRERGPDEVSLVFGESTDGIAMDGAHHYQIREWEKAAPVNMAEYTSPEPSSDSFEFPEGFLDYMAGEKDCLDLLTP